MIETIATSFFLVAGSFFMLVGAIGLVRMPDLFCRMHAATKAPTLGLGCLLLALFLHFGFDAVGLKAFIALTFLFLTAPVGAHMISRCAYRRGVELCDETVLDELEPLYRGTRGQERLKDPD